MKLISQLQQTYEGMSHRSRQFLNLGAVAVVGIGALWLVFSIGQPDTAAVQVKKSVKAQTTNLGIQPPGEIDPREAWIGTAGREVARLKADVESQQRKEVERNNVDEALRKRLADLEKHAAEGVPQFTPPGQPPSPAPVQQPAAPVALADQAGGYPPSSPLAASVPGSTPAAIGNALSTAGAMDVEAPVVRISLKSDNGKGMSRPKVKGTSAESGSEDKEVPQTYLPVSFTSGVLLGGIDAPTGGQAQSNPLPILVRLTDNAILPNRYRSEVKDCFVVAAGWGDISSERVYARTATLSCVRNDGSALEMPIQGNLYGEDGKLGLRGRLVTKQGQLLANALRAGIVGGIGQGFAQGGTSYTTSPFGTLATNSGGTGEQIRRGMAGGVGRALDNLANYYIRLAEQTFPVVEVDADRKVEVVITKGSTIPASGGQVELQDIDDGGQNEDG
jgi:conjugal transfer pilus assembly protein TraB